jgi:hypothetical protein
MKAIKYFLTIICLIIYSIFTLQAQSTIGQEFWLTFGSNFHNPYTLLDFQIRIVTGKEPTNVTIYFTNLSNSVAFPVNANEVYTYSLNNEQKQAVYNNPMGVTGITNYSMKITSTEPVSVYAMNHRSTSADATNILPVTAIGMEYYQVSYTPPNSFQLDAYAVVATQNNTHLHHNGFLEATLDVGEVYYRTINSDMTGAHITSDKPAAFFAVIPTTTIPTGGGQSACFMQQLASVNTWGKKFFVPVSHLIRDRVRIVVSQDGTNISHTGGTLVSALGSQMSLTDLQAGQFVELEIQSDETGCFIQSNYPVGVCTYLTGHNTGIPFEESNPAQCWVPAIEQSAPNTLIAPFVPDGYNQLIAHYALVCTPTATKDNTMVSIGGGAPSNLSGGSWRDHALGMSFYSMPLTNDMASYYFTNQKGLIILCFAEGIDSYYYLAGSAMRDLDAAFYANEIHNQDLKDNYFCDGFVNFRAEIEGLAPPTVAERIKWFVNGTEEPGTLNQETWDKTFNPGTYDIRMWVRYENDDTISKTGTLIIMNCSMETEFYANNVLHSSLKDTTFCNKSVNFRAEIEEVFSNWISIKWYVDYGSGEVEETSATNQTAWGKDFDNGTFPIKMVVVFENGETATRTGILKVQALWIKMRNIRY